MLSGEAPRADRCFPLFQMNPPNPAAYVLDHDAARRERVLSALGSDVPVQGFACVPDLERPPTHTEIPGLWLAGDYVASDYPATLEAAVRSGVAAARGIIAT